MTLTSTAETGNFLNEKELEDKHLMNKLLSKLLRNLGEKIGVVITIHRHETLLNKSYKIVHGTISKDVDYDDAWLLALSQEAKTIFDIGCNIGQSSLLMLHTNIEKDIILADPNPMALSHAASNLIMNNLCDKARFVCAFVSNKTGGQVEFFTIGSGAAGSMYPRHAITASSSNSKYEVPTTTIDTLIEKFDLVPDFIKIDVEGAESLVLLGASSLAKLGKTRFFVEMHSNPDLPMKTNAKKVINWCKDNHYQAWYLKEKIPLADPEQIAHRGRCHLLLQPSSEPFPRILLPLKQGASLEEVELN